jgi:hypothetical protein
MIPINTILFPTDGSECSTSGVAVETRIVTGTPVEKGAARGAVDRC